MNKKNKKIKKKTQQTKTLKKPIKTTKKTMKVKKRKLRFGRVFLVLFCFGCLYMLGKQILSLKVKSIFVKGNVILSDQDIIELAQLQEYPSYVCVLKKQLSSTLEANVYITKANIVKKKWKEIIIEVEENTPLFYDAALEKTILKDGSQVEYLFSIQILLIYVPDTLYELLKEKILLLDKSVYARISEIKYDPNEVDDKRFYLTMTDGNKVYLTLKKFEKINRYVDIQKEILTKYNNQKGILYLDEGEYFQVLEES